MYIFEGGILARLHGAIESLLRVASWLRLERLIDGHWLVVLSLLTFYGYGSSR